MMKQNVEIYLADATPCTRVVLVHNISITDFFKFWRNLVIPIGMAEYFVKSRRIPPKLEWLAAMHLLCLIIILHRYHTAVLQHQ